MTDTTIEHVDTADQSAHDDDHEAHHGPTDAFFIKTAIVLAVITGLEVAASYVELGALFLPILIGLMLIKFFAVVLIFMHVKYDTKIFGQLFYIGLGLAVGVYVVMLLCFQFFLK
ncbi:MAG: cytochrome C oxidase subunit IV family protein [Actinomycetota bacterium]